MSALPDTWHAKLELSFSRQASGKTVLSRRRHEGPLLVQKALYPEGPAVCHVTTLHPPSGIAGGDELTIEVQVDPGAHALVTTPGATRWYKANGKGSIQHTHIRVATGARLDWLPQENIFFEQADATVHNHIYMTNGGAAIGWEISQLGRVDKTTHWDEGRVMLASTLYLNGTPTWLECGELSAEGLLRHCETGLAGFPVLATLWAFGAELSDEQTENLARQLPWTASLRAGVTHMRQADQQGLTLVRVLGEHAQDVRRLFTQLWMHLRPMLLQTPAAPPRLWNT